RLRRYIVTQTCQSRSLLQHLTPKGKHGGDDHRLECRSGGLRLHIKGPDRFDLITEKFHAYRLRLSRRKHIEDAATQSKLSNGLYHRDTAIAALDQRRG